MQIILTLVLVNIINNKLKTSFLNKQRQFRKIKAQEALVS